MVSGAQQTKHKNGHQKFQQFSCSCLVHRITQSTDNGRAKPTLGPFCQVMFDDRTIMKTQDTAITQSTEYGRVKSTLQILQSKYNVLGFSKESSPQFVTQSNSWQDCCNSDLLWNLPGKPQSSLFAHPKFCTPYHQTTCLIWSK